MTQNTESKQSNHDRAEGNAMDTRSIRDRLVKQVEGVKNVIRSFRSAHPAVNASVRGLSRAWTWVRYQLVETWREFKRGARPPVKIKRRSGVLVVHTRRDLGGDSVLLVPMTGQRGMVGLGRSECDDVRARRHGIEFWAERPDGEKDVWPVVASNDKAEMDLAYEILSKGLTGGGGGLRGFGYALVAILVVVAAVGATKPGNRAAEAEPNQSAEARPELAAPKPTAALMLDAFGVTPPTQAQLPAPSAAEGSGVSLADQIYTQARAAADRTKYEQGPPQTPAVDPAIGDFGLGKSSKEGCDPALAFTVSE